MLRPRQRKACQHIEEQPRRIEALRFLLITAIFKRLGNSCLVYSLRLQQWREEVIPLRC